MDDTTDEFAMGFDFCSRDPGLKIVVVLNADQLVFGKMGFAHEIFQGPMALVDPLGGLSETDPVDFQEFLQSQVVRFETGVV